MIDQYKVYENFSESRFLREVGISKANFTEILTLLDQYITEEKQENKLKMRGRKSSINLENQLLMTLYHFRHYPTFSQLGLIFGTSESYANKIFHQISTTLTKILKMPDPKVLLDAKNLTTILIDASEQAIERPKKNKKNTTAASRKSTPSKPKSSSTKPPKKSSPSSAAKEKFTTKNSSTPKRQQSRNTLKS